jgi:hypothetical protein
VQARARGLAIASERLKWRALPAVLKSLIENVLPSSKASP